MAGENIKYNSISRTIVNYKSFLILLVLYVICEVSIIVRLTL